MCELSEILTKFADPKLDGTELAPLARAARGYLGGSYCKDTLLEALTEADRLCGSCGCEFDPLYKTALELVNKLPRRIAIGCDHGGYDLKLAMLKLLDAESDRYTYTDLGAHDGGRSDYPVYADLVCRAIADGKADCGILFCGTGIGMSMAANKHPGIRAACLSDTFSAKATREHNNANVLCLGGRVVGEGLAYDIIKLFLDTPFSYGERHIERIKLVMANEDSWNK